MLRPPDDVEKANMTSFRATEFAYNLIRSDKSASNCCFHPEQENGPIELRYAYQMLSDFRRGAPKHAAKKNDAREASPEARQVRV